MSTVFDMSVSDMTFHISALFPSTKHYCRDYLIDQVGQHNISLTQEHINFERIKFCEEYSESDPNCNNASDAYLETIALLRKFADYITLHNRFLMHGSSIEVHGKGYIFTALSGTGKSTHTGLLRKLLGDKVSMINDDKPFVHIENGKVDICGTPWMGKHHLGNNVIRPLAGIFFLRRSDENVIRKMTADEALPLLLSQIHRPVSNEHMLQTLEMMDLLLNSVPLYDLGCNMDISAAETSYSVMK